MFLELCLIPSAANAAICARSMSGGVAVSAVASQRKRTRVHQFLGGEGLSVQSLETHCLLVFPLGALTDPTIKMKCITGLISIQTKCTGEDLDLVPGCCTVSLHCSSEDTWDQKASSSSSSSYQGIQMQKLSGYNLQPPERSHVFYM